MENYSHQKIEQKWQRVWDELGLYQAKDFDKKPKAYILVEFPYLSGDGLHVGHVRSYSALDALVRKKRMQGYNVLYPIGWDAFGLPTENYAIKTGIHPIEITKKNIVLFKKQLRSLGLSFDWSREINTSDQQYYKWTQWIFLKLYEKGLAYTAKIPINWCPRCKIGLANEEVVSGQCERCGAEVQRREQRQWMLKITDYADRLLKDLQKLDYLEKIKAQQKNWIGRSCGVNIKFRAEGLDKYIDVFTTRADTLFGVTAMVLAPEHDLVKKITTKERKKQVQAYIKASKKKSELERTDLAKEKTGVFTGAYCINPGNNEKIPVWVGDYVIATYGGGSVMVVPAHDKRDYALAKKYGLKIKQVVKPSRLCHCEEARSADEAISSSPPCHSEEAEGRRGISSKILKHAYTDYGVLVNSGEFSGLNSSQAIEKIAEWLEKKDLGKKTVQYKLRDWVFSRQHYWGEPIPLVFCKNCKKQVVNSKSEIRNPKQIQNSKFKIQNFSKGELLNPGWIAVPEKDLPVELPYVKTYKPTQTGESPLANIKDWVNVKCPKCRGQAKRETDTMPNWAGSNWYFLRYLDPKNNKIFADAKKLKYWLPVDLYNGGMEHTTLHLLYSRFWHKFLYDIGVVPVDEPYAKRRSHGMVLGEDSRKMSKSFGNVVNPDDIVKKYGADVLRVYEMFMGPFDQAIAWDTKTILGVDRFLTKVRILTENIIQNLGSPRNPKSEIRNSKQIQNSNDQNSKRSLDQLKHKTIKKVSEDLENMKFNTAVACLMEYTNALIKEYENIRTPVPESFGFGTGQALEQEHIKTLLLLLAPFAPHLAEELWHQINPELDEKQSIFQEKWPEFDPELAKSKEIELVIQINGSVRDKVVTKADISQTQAEKIVLKRQKIQNHIKDKHIKKIIFVKGKLINFVLRSSAPK